LKAVLHQPQYFPYPGFFHKLMQADIFVLLDNTQYDKRFTNRNQIISSNNSIWITVPIDKKQKFSPNRLVEINNSIEWKNEHWKKIKYSYSNSEYFSLYEDYFKELFSMDWNFLCELNFETLKQTMKWLNIKTKIIKESDLKLEGKGSQRLIDGCKKIGADTYISGKGLPGKKYLDEDLFGEKNIKLEYQKYVPLEYEQHMSETFTPNLSILDLLFNIGPSSSKFIQNCTG
jgi:hypothetical protein|tara:strand:+ start:9178 stop:9870 length:693 start_codon:yes stop_codon:yes gene_type:complete